MKVTATKLEGVLLIEPQVWEDGRGCFFESYNQERFAAAGIGVAFVQDNHSRSGRNVLRGLHYQAPPFAQDKLVRTVAGEVYDVVVDLRHGSPTFGQWAGFELTAGNRRMLFVPKGYAHGFCVLGNSADVLYKCSALYAPQAARGIRWNDPDLAIDWPVRDPVLSAQDRTYPHFRDLGTVFRYAP